VTSAQPDSEIATAAAERGGATFRATADYTGMLAIVLNCLTMQDAPSYL
jgi:uridylate kinase